MRAPRRTLRTATPPVAGSPRLSPIATAQDDPVLAALCRLHEVSMEPRDGERMVDHSPGKGDRFPDAMPEFSFGPAGGNYSGQALVLFSADPYIRYIRNTRGVRLQIPDTMLPATVVQGIVGLPVPQVADIPGLEDWVVSHVGWDMVAERHEVFIEPGPATPKAMTR